ncbi:unnamed protein product [Arctia plantaginis]|uniref:Uncharacterized protein n=1 Tax=Arctia plantaginis TaxID=874455 RepID=A0A8S1A544_ARCPL|nr:unnamed protein product [Arctia plantaginis]
MPLNPRDEGANKGVKTRAQRAAGTTDVEEGASPTSGHAHIGTSSDYAPCGAFTTRLHSKYFVRLHSKSILALR